jgi:hypothetical protein
MGRPFQTELEALHATYEWSRTVDIAEFTESVISSSDRPLWAIGSGGSYSAAHYAAYLHQTATMMPSKAVTPMEAINVGSYRYGAASIWSAGGSNTDIIAAAQHVLQHDPDIAAITCLRPDSKLAKLADSYSDVFGTMLDGPWKADGFLSVNSLLTFFTICLRAYTESGFLIEPLPTASELFGPVPFFQSAGAPEHWLAALARRTLVVLYGPNTHALAVDIESKFTEAALQNVSIADYRNFAHGRHHWIAKQGAQTAVVALISPGQARAASAILDLIPKETPIVRFETTTNISASLSLLPTVLRFVQAAGSGRGIDPGRPGVPRFGSRMYNLRGLAVTKRTRSTISLAVRRKVEPFMERREAGYWADMAKGFIERLSRTTFTGLVLDYDGTICGRRHRFGSLPPEIADQLRRLLQSGLRIGIATGRGRSARASLRESIPEGLWPGLLIGYYNGAEVGALSDESCPLRSEVAAGALLDTAHQITQDPVLKRVATIEVRPHQITLEPKSGISVKELWQLSVEGLRRGDAPGDLDVVHSTHSVDILSPGVSKLTVVRAVSPDAASSDRVLCIGDLGRWPGNDYRLLSTKYSLSCDQTSTSPDTCWNLAPPGLRGFQATTYYLEHIAVKGGEGLLKLPIESES